MYKKKYRNKTYMRPSYSSRTAPGQRFVQRSSGNSQSITETKHFHATASVNIPFFGASGWNGTSCDPATSSTLFYPTLGTNAAQRVGRIVSVKSIYVRAHLKWSPGSSANAVLIVPPTVRVLLFVDKQTNGVQAQGNDLMYPGPPPIVTTQSPQNVGRFIMLKDKTIQFSDPNFGIATSINKGGLTRYLVFNYKFKKPLVIKFNSLNNGQVSDISDNSFHIFAGSDIDPTGYIPVTLSYVARITYVDQ